MLLCRKGDKLQKNILIPIEKLDLLEEYGIQQSRGILLEGPPGVGKTLLSKVIANKVDCTFIAIYPSDIIYGSEIRPIYKAAKNLAPTIILFEDVDMIAPSRESYEGMSSGSKLSELMLQLAGVEELVGVFTIATTNRPGVIEKALVDRPGRIDRRIEMTLPTPEQRRELIRLMLGEKIKISADVNMKNIIEQTKDFTGADIRELVYVALMEVLESNPPEAQRDEEIILEQKHLDIGLSKVKKEQDKYKNLYA